MTDRYDRLVVSFCNFGNDPRPTGLLHIEASTWRSGWIDIGCADSLRVSGTGICVDERYLYHLSIAQLDHTSTLSVLDRSTLEVVHVQDLPEVSDGHSIARSGDELIVASTGHDELVAYRLSGYKPVEARTLWTPTGSGTDSHHVNSVAVIEGDVVCSAFGPTSGGSWADARDGYLLDVSRGSTVAEGLRQPHSVAGWDGRLHVCNSVLGTVDEPAGVVAHLAGYSRGLAFTPDYMYAGTSLGRRRGRDPGGDRLYMNPNDHGESHGRCALIQVPHGGGARLEVGLGFAGAEIYDIQVL